MYRLIAFDLDGTFLDDEKQIPEETLRAIERAAGRGVEIVPATGRIYRGIPEELKALPFIRYYILSNGAAVYDAREDKVLLREEIPADTVIASFGMKPNNALVDAICEKYPTTAVIGDCISVGQVGEAVRGGFFAAWSIH